jgi:hypothetical protein
MLNTPSISPGADFAIGGVWLVAMLGTIAVVYFVPRLLGVRIHITRV